MTLSKVRFVQIYKNVINKICVNAQLNETDPILICVQYEPWIKYYNQRFPLVRDEFVLY